MNEYTIIYEKTATGYSAYVPDLPGCVTTGATLQQTKANMQEAIGGHLHVMREYGDPIPAPTTVAESLAVPA
jgi:predicted RNase H-like HicB family nuclease